MKKYMIGLVALIMVACGDENEIKNVELGVEFALGQGDAAIITTPDLRLDVTELSDSRCPEGAQCFWEGEAKVLFTFEVPGGVIKTDSLSLSLNSTFNRSIVVIDNYTIELLDMTPYPELGKKVKNQTATMIITQN